MSLKYVDRGSMHVVEHHNDFILLEEIQQFHAYQERATGKNDNNNKKCGNGLYMQKCNVLSLLTARLCDVSSE
jgi:hypothetical protein